ncbi:MAG: TIGR02452 family protein [Pirellulaceae bacterium]
MSLKQHAKDVLDLIDRGVYFANGHEVAIQPYIQSSLDGSRIYTPDQLTALRERLPSGTQPTIEVVNGTTQTIAQTMAKSGPVLLLNFASARNPGGGFLNGAKAQEEDLCRCSALYPTLIRHMEYYDANRNQSSLLYTDYAIYSPAVPFFKTRGTGDLLETPFLSSVVTAPAPNSKPYLANSGDASLLKQCFERRWRNVLAIASDVGIANVLLGAWGCGAFGGDPAIASNTAKNALTDFGPAFDRVVFAIPGKGKQSRFNLETFANTLSVAH